MRTLLDDWLPEPLTVATWMLKSFTTGVLCSHRCSSSTSVAWGDCCDTSCISFLLSDPLENEDLSELTKPISIPETSHNLRPFGLDRRKEIGPSAQGRSCRNELGS